MTAHSKMELGLGHVAVILKPFEEHELDSYLEQGPPQRKFSLFRRRQFIRGLRP